MTVAGGVSSGELLVSVTGAPPAGAAPFSSTKTGAGAPPVTAFGVGPRRFSDDGSTVVDVVDRVDPA